MRTYAYNLTLKVPSHVSGNIMQTQFNERWSSFFVAKVDVTITLVPFKGSLSRPLVLHANG